MAKKEPSYDKNRKRLADIIPLDTPFTVYLEPTRLCNFKCFYCMHSTRDDAQGELAKTGFKLENIDQSFYRKLLLDFKEFPRKIKRVVFSGLGEPLVNAMLPMMIENAWGMSITERIDIITNGVLLTPAKIDALVMAKTSRIQISLQGLSEEDYRLNCGTSINFGSFLDNLRYLYENKGDTSIYIKILDVMLKNENEKKMFFDMFSDKCDSIFIEHLLSLEQQMGELDGKADNRRNLFNEENEDRFVCSVPFYHFNINIDGEVFPCPVPGLPKEFSYGNARHENLVDIWNGNRRRNFLLAQLKIGRKKINWCKTCVNNCAIVGQEENLDDDTERLATLL